MQLKRRIREKVRQARASKARPKSADRDPGVVRIIPEHEAADNDVLLDHDESASAEIRQSRIDRLVVIIHFDQADSGRRICPADDRGVSAGLKRRHDDRFAIVRWLEWRAFDLRTLRAV